MAFMAPALAAMGGGSAAAGGIALASTAISAGMAISSASAQRQAAKHNARVEENAAMQADLDARESLRRFREQAKRFMGAQRAAIAGSGTLGTTGSPLEILGKTAGDLEIQAQDQMTVASRSYGASVARAGMMRWEGGQAMKAGLLSATGSLIKGFAGARA